MTTVEVFKKDETLIQIRCDDSGVLMEISEFFTFMADGYKFMPAYKNKIWDGKVRLYNSRNHTLPFGLLAHLADFCKSHKYNLSIDESVLKRAFTISDDDLDEWLQTIPLSSRGTKIEARDYQLNAFRQAIKEGRSLLISPTASGKSLIIYLMLRWYLDHYEDDKSVLIIVPTTSLVSQMKGDFKDYSQYDKTFNGDADVHEIYSGKEKDIAGVKKLRVDLTNGTAITLDVNDKVMLTIKKWKFAKDLTCEDDICETWIKEKTKS